MSLFPKKVKVMYMGEFEDCDYIGGISTEVTILNEGVYNLRYQINHELPPDWRSAHYGMYYTSRNWFNKKKKHLISSDDDVLKLCEGKSVPVVYIEHDVMLPPTEHVGVVEPVALSEPDVYVPSYEYPQSTVLPDEGLEAIQRYASEDWFAEGGFNTIRDWGNSSSSQPWGSSSQPWASWLQQDPAQLPAHDSQSWGYFQPHEQPGTSAQTSQPCSSWPSYVHETYEQGTRSSEPDEVCQGEGVDVDDDDYEEQVGVEATDEDESEPLSDNENIKFTACEFAAWVRREGGMGRLLGMINSRGGDEDDPEPLPDVAEMTNWLVPVFPLDVGASFVQMHFNPAMTEELKFGSIFKSKDEVSIAVGLWCLKRGREATPHRSEPTKICFKCRHSDTCTFNVRAKTYSGMRWRIYKFEPEHPCSREVGELKRITAHADVVAAHVAQKIHEDGEFIKPKDIQFELRSEFGVHITYDLALRARNLAIELIYGSHDQSYQLVPSYLHMLSRCNPGSQIDWEVGPDGRFRHCFVALGACISAYLLSSLRPVVVIDGTHLKGKGKGVLFIAATKDGNEALYPLAYGVGPKENDESWGWFLSRFVRAYGSAEPLLVVSDQHVSIANAVRREMPHAHHGLCYYHIKKNLSGYDQDVKDVFQEAAYSYDGAVVDKCMAELQIKNNKAWKKLTDMGVEKWARAKCPVRRYCFITSNVAESLNSRLMWARRLPICSLLESMRIVFDEWFGQKRAAAENSSEVLTNEAHGRVAVEEREARRYVAKRVNDHVYKVRAGHQILLVDLYERTCECGVFQIDELPCSHAIAAIIKKGRTIEEYVGVYYRRDSLIDVYSGSINHLPPRAQWTVPQHIANLVILPPIVTRQAGRPRQSRIRGASERARRSTSNHPDLPIGSTRKRCPKKCGICGEAGHTRRKCPENPDL